MTRFGDLLGGVETVATPITTPAPVVKPPAPPAPLVQEGKGVTKQELMKLSKIIIVCLRVDTWLLINTLILIL